MPTQSTRPRSAQKPAPFATRFVNFWWVTIPSKLRRYSTLIWAAWSDGLYLTTWPRLATTLVFAVLLFGFAEGATHWSYRTIVGSNGLAGNVLAPMATANDWGGPTHLVFADNLLLLMIGVALGTLSANLGITLVIGYALGDLFGPSPPFGAGWRNIDPFNAWVYRHVPLLTSYILFFMLVALPILMAMELARTSHERVARSKGLMVTVTALIDAALIYCWGAFAPMVFRTVPLWSGGTPRITVPFYSHITAVWIVPTAIVSVLVRAVIVGAAAKRNTVRDGDWMAALRMRGAPPGVPQSARAIIAAGVITLLIMGFMHSPSTYEPRLLTNFGEAELVFLAIAAVLLARVRFAPSAAWGRWAASVEQYPAALRLAVATAASYVLCLVLVAIPGLQSSRPGEFGPELATILVGLALAIVLLPHGWAELSISNRVLPWRRVPKPSFATQIGIIGALLMLTSKKAFADCSDFACCMAAAAKAAAAAAAGGVSGLSGIAAGVGLGATATQPSGAQAADPAPATDPVEAQAYKGAGAAIGAVIGGVLGGPAGAVLGGLIGGIGGAAFVKAGGPAMVDNAINKAVDAVTNPERPWQQGDPPPPPFHDPGISDHCVPDSPPPLSDDGGKGVGTGMEM